MNNQYYKNFKVDFTNLLLKSRKLAAHGTNSYALRYILNNGLVKQSKLNTIYSGETIHKMNSKRGVSVCYSEYKYYLITALDYAERAAKNSTPNRAKYINDYIKLITIIKFEGGIKEYSEKVLRRKRQSYTVSDLRKYIIDLEERLNDFKSDPDFIPKYNFELQKIEYQLKALYLVKVSIFKRKDLNLDQIDNPYIRYYAEVLTSNRKRDVTPQEIEIRIKKLEKTLISFSNLTVKEKDSLINTDPAVIIFDVDELELKETTSNVLCERVVNHIDSDRIKMYFTTSNHIADYSNKGYDIEYLYRYCSEEIL